MSSNDSSIKTLPPPVTTNATPVAPSQSSTIDPTGTPQRTQEKRPVVATESYGVVADPTVHQADENASPAITTPEKRVVQPDLTVGGAQQLTETATTLTTVADSIPDTEAAQTLNAAAEALTKQATLLRARRQLSEKRMRGLKKTQWRATGVVEQKGASFTFKPDDPSIGKVFVPREMGITLPLGKSLVAELKPTGLTVEDPSGVQKIRATVKKWLDRLLGRPPPPVGPGELSIEVPPEDVRTTFAGEVVKKDEQLFFRHLFDRTKRPRLIPLQDLPPEVTPGSILVVDLKDPWEESCVARPARFSDGHLRLLAEGGTVKAEEYRIAAKDYGLDPVFSPAAMAEVAEFLEDPGTDDPALADLTDIPFISIDPNPPPDEDELAEHGEATHHPDIDQFQAHVPNPETGGETFYYGVADVWHYAPPGSALYEEALRRGGTTYMMGTAIPMLPRELCERICSLNENEVHRSFVLKFELDADGKVLDVQKIRAKAINRLQLTYKEAQEFFDDPQSHPELLGQDFTESLLLFKDFGIQQQKLDRERNVVPFERNSARPRLTDRQGTGIELVEDTRYECEEWNAYQSIMSNSYAGGMFYDMVEPGDPVVGVFRAHPDPPRSALAALSDVTKWIAEDRQLDPETWTWDDKADGLDQLGDFFVGLRNDEENWRLKRAIEFITVTSYRPAQFQTKPGRHSALHRDHYARITGPMREPVTFAFELKDGAAPGEVIVRSAPLPVLERLAAIGNADKKRNNALNQVWEKMALDTLFRPDLSQPFMDRPTHLGTVVKVSLGRVTVQLDDPPAIVKLPLKELNHRNQGQYELSGMGGRLDFSPAEPDLSEPGLPSIRIGDPIFLKADAQSPKAQKIEMVVVDQAGHPCPGTTIRRRKDAAPAAAAS